MLSAVAMEGDVIDVRVAPPAEVGTFSEEERSKQVGFVSFIFCYIAFAFGKNLLIGFNLTIRPAITFFCCSFPS